MQNNDIEQRIISQFTKIGFVNLTNIQKQSYSIIRKKKNILLVAPTGSGKTEAAIIPIIVEILNSRPEKNKVSVLYITPLRADHAVIIGGLETWRYNKNTKTSND